MSALRLPVGYRYRIASALEDDGGSPRLRLSTSGGASENPVFFRGRLLHPRATADALLLLGQNARTRFFMPTPEAAFADPVITSGGEMLRLESFSSCCGVYARVDLLPDGIDGEWIDPGTTNVDFNQPMRAALTRIRDGDAVALAVGTDAFELETGADSVVEKKVALPLRWVRGFLEVQALQTGQPLRFELDRANARKFLQAVPTSSPKKPSFVTRSGKGARFSQRESKDSARIGGPHRLRLFEGLWRHAEGLRIYGGPKAQASAVEVRLKGMRVTLVLSASLWRGLSGEGAALSALADADPKTQSAIRAALGWSALVDPKVLAASLNKPVGDVRAGLALLGARGLVGYDLAAAGYFHRELPFDLSQVETLQPRLKNARKLVADGAVRVESQTGGAVVAEVRGSGVQHRVRLGDTGSVCTCPWFSKHQAERGPCKHVLAVQLVLEEGPSE